MTERTSLNSFTAAKIPAWLIAILCRAIKFNKNNHHHHHQYLSAFSTNSMFVSPFYRWRVSGKEKLSNLAKVTEWPSSLMLRSLVMSDSLGSMDCSPPGSSVCGDSPGKNTGVGCHALFQGIFPTQGSNPGLPYFKWILYHLSHQGSLKMAVLGIEPRVSCMLSMCSTTELYHQV